MSKYHGEQYWSELRHQAKHDWRELTDEHFDFMAEIRHDRELRTRDQRSRARRNRRFERSELEI